MHSDAAMESQRLSLLAEIDAAFADVTREDGTSWSESRVVDDRGSDAERREARASDHDTHWSQLVDDPNWDPDMGIGGWCFLDPIGTRYYLPAGMKRGIRDGWAESLQLRLTFDGGELDEWSLGKLSLLNERQNKCVALFIQYMIAVTRRREEKQYELYAVPGESRSLCDTAYWEAAFESHWKMFL
jgi:hypothetical protein